MKTSIRYQMMKQQRIGVFLLIIFIAIVEFLLHFDALFASEKYVVASNQLVALQRKLQVENNNNHYHFNNTIKLYNFNPNEFSANDWQNFGFSEKQAATIIKYKSILGGTFTSKEQLKKCFVISEEKFASLKPYILLPEKSPENIYQSKNEYTKKDIENIKYYKFNPNEFSIKDWQSFGFSEKQAATIIKYKSILGGTFTSKEQLKKCFVVNEEKYNALEKYIQLGENQNIEKNINPNNSIKIEKKIALKSFNPNDLDEQGWIELGFSPKQVGTILRYKNSLGGTFTSKEQLKKCYVISEEKFNELLPFIKLE